MALEPIHQFYIRDGKPEEVDLWPHREVSGGIYEVLRIVQGVPLFWEEHVRRMQHSALLAGVTLPASFESVRQWVGLLVKLNNCDTGNVMLLFKDELRLFFIPHKYPDEVLYLQGIRCGLLEAERINPHAKVVQTQVRQRADELIRSGGFYEVLLVDHLGRITEGSRSNVFFVKGNTLITPPLQQVLPGITRQKTIRCAEEQNIPWEERDVFVQECGVFDAAFITGTSPKILPIHFLESRQFDPQNKIVVTLMAAYNALIEAYINNARY